MNHAMFSPEALAHFKKFSSVAQRDRAARRTSPVSNPAGAFDVSTPELKRAIAIARDATPDVELDPQTLWQVMEVLKEAFGDEAHTAVSEALDRAFPNCVRNSDPEAPHIIEDEADRDWPPANAGGKPGEMQQAEDDDFSPAGQFAAMGHDMPVPFPGMPKPGAKMVAQDRALRRAEKQRDAYFADYPSARRFGNVTHIPTREPKANAVALDKALARHQAAMKSYDDMFPNAARIRVV